MNRILVADSPTISVWVYPERKLIHHEMKAYCHGAEFREALTKGTDAMKRHKATKWLADSRASNAIPKDDDDWIHASWLPRTLAAGWKHWAIVPPPKVIAQIRLGRVGRSFGELGVNARIFSDPDEAMRWLDEV